MNTQSISRQNLAEIYAQVCSGWQQKIDTLLSEQKFSTEISISGELIRKALEEANEGQKKLIKKHFVLPKNILESVQTFADILNILGKTEGEVLVYRDPESKLKKRLNALAKLALVEEVLNEGWNPDWSNAEEYKYYPWFKYCAPAGWVFDDCSYYVCYGAVAVPAYFKTSKIAEFVGKTFIDLYKEVLDR